MVQDRRTKVDWAECIRTLLVEHYPMAKQIVLVMDNLNTHCLSSLYEAFGPAEARGLAARLEIHYTPKHGSWLNVAEIEQSVLAQQALGRRVPDHMSMNRLTTTWAERRNRANSTVDWRLTTTDARIKLKRLYPNVDA